ncbi:phosphatidylglycerophosphatase A [Chloroherpeton thalassium ATCC 35110]|uniref:Phosphatidylglycerophosphatase A n=1 Tax=Chloroherpeton thalassium (strain ATCC 35110 / GB-78) TaxID=517418 RepID=B3QWV5_CHLT3|nr:phosphatidylglycerophosphatase A [Chloroherpeton thalassium]ACF13319.1 phosphatidylglycerophosphatase A [Chloroherpeton thalassium ATCC 35110]
MKMLLAKILGTGFGTGYFPFASGTLGSALAVAMYWFIPGFSETTFLLLAALIFFFAGVWASSLLEEPYGQDPSEATIDELVGQWIALLFLPKTLLSISLAFAAFRFFDITKIEPANQLQKLPRGWGVMMDDVMAGIYANLFCHAIYFLLGQLSSQ